MKKGTKIKSLSQIEPYLKVGMRVEVQNNKEYNHVIYPDRVVNGGRDYIIEECGHGLTDDRVGIVSATFIRAYYPKYKKFKVWQKVYDGFCERMVTSIEDWPMVMASDNESVAVVHYTELTPVVEEEEEEEEEEEHSCEEEVRSKYYGKLTAEMLNNAFSTTYTGRTVEDVLSTLPDKDKDIIKEALK